MLTDEMRRFMHARRKVQNTHVNPIVELIDAAEMMAAAAQVECASWRDSLEALRPVWTEMPNAYGTSVALAEIWQMLGVTNQTAAMEVLREISFVVPVSTAPLGRSHD